LEGKVPISSFYDVFVDNSAALGIQGAVCIFFSSCIKSDVVRFSVAWCAKSLKPLKIPYWAGPAFGTVLANDKRFAGVEFRGLALCMRLVVLGTFHRLFPEQAILLTFLLIRFS
jgi:hypothetical protein